MTAAPEIVLRGVDFGYDESRLLLDDATVTARAGTWTALTGASGVGKSTLLHLVAGTLRPRHGTLAVGEVTPSIAQATWIGQHTVIIDGTLKENILLGRHEASDEAVKHAAAAAGLGALMERGLELRIGDGGYGVSSGEARRIAIARAILTDKQLWILDEPTAHLDHDTEREIVASLQQVTEGRTVLVATHSEQVISACDTIWSLDGGVLSEVSV